MNKQSKAVSADEELVLFHQDGAIGTLRLNQPSSRNALSTDMMAAIQEHLNRIGEDRSIFVVVIESSGPVFSSGHNLKEMSSDSRKQVMQELFNQCSEMMQSIVNLSQPVIAKVSGLAAAAGCQLVASCDLAFASDKASFLTPGVNMGLFCSTPMVALSRNVSPKHAMEMLLSGEAIDAEHAARIGLINRVTSEQELDHVVAAFAARIASKSPLTVEIGKEAFYRQLTMPLKEAYEFTSEIMSMNMQTHDAKEGIDAFFEKRAPVWKGE